MKTADLAFILAVVALAWNLFTAWVRWPRIGVVMRQSVEVTAGPIDPTTPGPRDTYYLIVVNNGAEPASIANVGIRSEDSTRRFDVEYKRDRGSEVEGPDLPARCEAHGAIVWTLREDQLGDFPRGTRIVGYAHRYKTLRIVPQSIKDIAGNFGRSGRVWKAIYNRESPVRVHETKIRYTKN